MTDKRRSIRYLPKRAITVAIDDNGVPLAYGVVANISEGGACVLTDGVFEVGERLILLLSLSREPLPVETAGRVVWMRPTRDQGIVRYGLQWDDVSAHVSEDLRRLITADTATLKPADPPGAS
jgi:Tfp pilus assembly protein PilZ